MGTNFKFTNLIYILFLPVIIIGCKDSEDNPLQEYDVQECEIAKQIGNAMGFDYQGHPSTWSGVTWTASPDPSTGVRHIQGLKYVIHEGWHEIPESLGELPYLKRLELEGLGIAGDIPEGLANRQTLDTLHILFTRISSIPDNIFNSHMKYATIKTNLYLRETRLPSSIVKLKGKDSFRQFDLMSNRFTGTIPALKDVNILLDGNHLSGYDFENAFNASQTMRGDEAIKGYEDEPGLVFGVWAGGNQIHGEIPEKLLADTLALIHFTILVRPGTQYGPKFTNMPSTRELRKMAHEFYSRHPEYADLTSSSFFPGNSFDDL